MASRMVFEMPSASDGSTKQSSPRMTSGTSSRSPGSQARWPTPAASSTAWRFGAQRAVADHHQAQPIDKLRLELQGTHEGLRQQRLCFHRLHAAHSADDEQRWVGEWAVWPDDLQDISSSESLKLDAVVDLCDTITLDPDTLHQIGLKILRERHVAMHERCIQAPDALVMSVAAVDVGQVATVFAVNTHRHTGRPCRRLHFQGRKVSGMDD